MPHRVIMFDVFMFMLNVDSLNQMINPLIRQQGFHWNIARNLGHWCLCLPRSWAHIMWLTGSPKVQEWNCTIYVGLC